MQPASLAVPRHSQGRTSEHVAREDQLDRWADVKTHRHAEAVYEIVLLLPGRASPSFPYAGVVGVVEQAVPVGVIRPRRRIAMVGHVGPAVPSESSTRVGGAVLWRGGISRRQHRRHRQCGGAEVRATQPLPHCGYRHCDHPFSIEVSSVGCVGSDVAPDQPGAKLNVVKKADYPSAPFDRTIRLWTSTEMGPRFQSLNRLRIKRWQKAAPIHTYSARRRRSEVAVNPPKGKVAARMIAPNGRRPRSRKETGGLTRPLT
jgi:hypothetical protein